MKVIEEKAKDGNRLTRIILSPTVWIKHYHNSGDTVLSILFNNKKPIISKHTFETIGKVSTKGNGNKH